MPASPTVRHRRLAAELRRRREYAGLSPEQAAAAAGFSRSKLVLIETAKSTPKVVDVEAVLDAYGVQDQLRSALIQVARDIRKRGWWTAYGDVLSGSFAELEDAASIIRTWQLEVVPGLLQTESYARAIISADHDEAETNRHVQARMLRQAVLKRANAPKLWVLLHQMALTSPVGDPQVLRDQLAELLIAARRPHISIRVMPASATRQAGIGEGSFDIFSFPEPLDLDVGHLDSVFGDLYAEDVEQVKRCNFVYERIAEACLSEEDSAALIAALMEE